MERSLWALKIMVGLSRLCSHAVWQSCLLTAPERPCKIMILILGMEVHCYHMGPLVLLWASSSYNKLFVPSLNFFLYNFYLLVLLFLEKQSFIFLHTSIVYSFFLLRANLPQFPQPLDTHLLDHGIVVR